MPTDKKLLYLLFMRLAKNPKSAVKTIPCPVKPDEFDLLITYFLENIERSDINSQGSEAKCIILKS